MCVSVVIEYLYSKSYQLHCQKEKFLCFKMKAKEVVDGNKVLWFPVESNESI